MLAYVFAAEALNEYLQMSEEYVLLSTKSFRKEVIAGDEYFREPIEADPARIMLINAARGSSGCLGFIEYQHWDWNYFPIVRTGQFKGKKKSPTSVPGDFRCGNVDLEHILLLSGGHKRYPWIEKIDNGGWSWVGTVPSFLVVQSLWCPAHRTILYYLADGIYPNWAIFNKTITTGLPLKERAYVSVQEAMRKDIESAFGVITV